MCDYSVVAMRTRLAVEGEELVVCRFSSGSLGLTTPAEHERYTRENSGWRAWILSPQAPCAVCIPPGAQLVLHDIPDRLQHSLGVGPVERVTFIQTSLLENRHRDGVEFQNHQRILLQRLSEGQRVRVLTVSGSEAEPQPLDLTVDSGDPVLTGR
jgi:hypothetical protein